MEDATRHVDHFASLGLRTLVLAKRTLDEAEATAWLARFHEAATALSQRERRLAEAAELVEERLELIGVTAVEDKLQEGVPSTIAQLQRANIKIWMLTGDKQETAINIGYASRLLTSRMQLLSISGLSSLEHTRKVIAARYSEVQSWRLQFGQHAAKRAKRPLALVIDGAALHFCDEDRGMRRLFLSMVADCTAVVACRVSPLQKADIVRLVKRHMESSPLTLAIGDGANDVSMIQEAHVGVGVSGREGMQAVRAADYAIAQFAYLRRLLLVHGFWNYQRVTFVVLYTVYKQGLFVFSLFFYNMYNGMTGTALYDPSMIVSYSMAYSFLPILYVGIMDQSIRDTTANDYPQSYYVGQQGRQLNLKQMCLWEGTALLHAGILFFLTLNLFFISSNERDGRKSDTPSPHSFSADYQGRDADMFTVGAAVNFMVVVTANMKLLLSMNMFSRPTLSCKGVIDFLLSLGACVAIGVCALSWFWITAFFSLLQGGEDMPIISVLYDARLYGVFPRVLSSLSFWLAIPLVPLAALIPDIASKAYLRTYAPETLHLLQEVSASEGLRGRKVAPLAGKDSANHGTSPHEAAAGGALGEIIASRLVRELDGAAVKGGNDEGDLGSRDVPMHKFSCVFTSDPELEKDFRLLYNQLGVRHTIKFLSVGWIFLAIYFALSIARKADYYWSSPGNHSGVEDVGAMLTLDWGLGPMSTALMLAGLVVMIVAIRLLHQVKWIATKMQTILVAFLSAYIMGAAVGAETAANAVIIFPLISFIMIRVRFPLAAPLCVCHIVFFGCVWGFDICPREGADCKMKPNTFVQVALRPPLAHTPAPTRGVALTLTPPHAHPHPHPSP